VVVAQRPLATTFSKQLPPEVVQGLRHATPPASGPLIIPTNAQPVPLRTTKPSSRSRGSVKFIDVLQKKNPEINEQKLQQLQSAAAQIQSGTPRRPVSAPVRGKPVSRKVQRTRVAAADSTAPREEKRVEAKRTLTSSRPAPSSPSQATQQNIKTEKDKKEHMKQSFKPFKPVTKIRPQSDVNRKPSTESRAPNRESGGRKKPSPATADEPPRRNRLTSASRSRTNKRPLASPASITEKSKAPKIKNKTIRKGPRRLVPLKRPFAKPVEEKKLEDKKVPTLDANDEIILAAKDEKIEIEENKKSKLDDAENKKSKLDDAVDVPLEEKLIAKMPSKKLVLKKEEKDDKQGMIVGEFTVKSSEPEIFDETTLEPETTTLTPTTTISTTAATTSTTAATTTTSEKPTRGGSRGSRLPSNTRTQSSPQRSSRTRVSTGAVRVAPVPEAPVRSGGRRGSRGNARGASRVVAPSQPDLTDRVRIRPQSTRQRSRQHTAQPEEELAVTTARPSRRRG